MKTFELVNAFGVLNSAKLSKLEDKEKYVVIRAMRSMKPLKKDYEEAVQDAQNKLRADDHDQWQQRADQWNALHRGKKRSELSPAETDELDEINAYFRRYADSVEQAVKDLAEKEAGGLDYERLTEQGFSRLLASNPDWEAEKSLMLYDILIDN